MELLMDLQDLRGIDDPSNLEINVWLVEDCLGLKPSTLVEILKLQFVNTGMISTSPSLAALSKEGVPRGGIPRAEVTSKTTSHPVMG